MIFLSRKNNRNECQYLVPTVGDAFINELGQFDFHDCKHRPPGRGVDSFLNSGLGEGGVAVV